MDEFKLALKERNKALTGISKPLDGAALQVLWATVGCDPEKPLSRWDAADIFDCIEKSTKFERLFKTVKKSDIFPKNGSGDIRRSHWTKFKDFVVECVVETMKSAEHLELLRRSAQGRAARVDSAYSVVQYQCRHRSTLFICIIANSVSGTVCITLVGP